MARLNLFSCKDSSVHPLHPFWPARRGMARPPLKIRAWVDVRLPRKIATHYRIITRRFHVLNRLRKISIEEINKQQKEAA
ncbi:hypothetical protein BMS3Abin13_00994 [bacterium BMS3Abin13]|nr:hypothetical protein BMS3Abin13_00994 [bacterium BMS3Abin13]